MQRIVYTNSMGGVSTIVPNEGARLATRVTLADGTVLKGSARPVDQFQRRWPIAGAIVEWAETEDEFVARIMAKDLPSDATGAKVVSQIPGDRTFRGAWELDETGVTVNMTKAREIHKDKLRRLREPRLKEMDVEYLLADEAGDVSAKAEIALKKRILRDVTKDPAIEEAGTPEELTAVVPSVLKNGGSSRAR